MINIHNISVSEAGSIAEPVSLAELKRFPGVDFSDDDELLEELNKAARQQIEQELVAKLVDSSVSFYLTTSKDEEELTVLPWALNFSDADNVVVSLIENGEADEVLTEDDDYYYNGSLIIGESSKTKVEYDLEPVVPEAIKEAIKMLAAYRYNNRGDQEKQQGIPEDVEAKISKYRQVWL